MPPRLSKRQQRELEEVRSLSAVVGPSIISDEDSSDDPHPHLGGGGFSALFVDDDEDDGDGEDTKASTSKSRKPKKKKKKSSTQTATVPAAPGAVVAEDGSEETRNTLRQPQPPPTPRAAPVAPRNEKKAAKKARAKEKKAANDELDQALAELSLRYPASSSSSPPPPPQQQQQQQQQQTSIEGGHDRPPPPPIQRLSELLSVSLPFLDADAEMRRFFGSKAVLASRSSAASGPSASSSSSSAEAAALARANKKALQSFRSHLTRPKATWVGMGMVRGSGAGAGAGGREGLSVRSYSDDEVGEKMSRQRWASAQQQQQKVPTKERERWWTVECSRTYKSMTWAFMSAVMAGDPQGLFDILGVFPWHADTLLQISEVHRHREEHAQAVEFVERALFTYERCLMGAFNFTTGLNRLDFDRVENRPFFLALHRQIADLQRRGCVRASFEFGRLLYGLDPWNDPHGAAFHLEHLAVRAGMGPWLLDVYDVFEARRKGRRNAAAADGRSGTEEEEDDRRLDPSVLPGWAYSRALALKIGERDRKEQDHTKSSEALREAARDFPSVVPLLADKLDVALPAALRARPDFKIETDAQSLPSEAMAVLHLLSHLYVQRTSGVWKDHAAWFSTTIAEAFSLSSSSSSSSFTERKRAFLALYGDDDDDDGNRKGKENLLRYSIYRHVMVLETSYRRLFSFLPRRVTQTGVVGAGAGAGAALACDPLPPPDGTAMSGYDDEFFRGAKEGDGEGGLLEMRRRRRGRGRREVDGGGALERVVPNPALRRQIQGFFEDHPNVAQRFPGGVVQFARLAAEMAAAIDVDEDGGDEGLLDDLMLVERALNAEEVGGGGAGGGGGGMPGGLGLGLGLDLDLDVQREEGDRAAAAAELGPGDQDRDDPGDIDVESEEDEEDDEDEYPMTGALRNVFGRIFGGRTTTFPESDSSESDEDVD